jgi:hypothetical protein
LFLKFSKTAGRMVFRGAALLFFNHESLVESAKRRSHRERRSLKPICAKLLLFINNTAPLLPPLSPKGRKVVDSAFP